jgi:polysaccharide pyruvyl transferase WcaK-like protein/glycosyltransferase involved in cell wall biosynthesis
MSDMRVGMLHPGGRQGGIARYGRRIAAALGARPGVETMEAEVDLRGGSALGAVGACLSAAWRLRRADAVLVPYSPNVWGPRRVRFIQAALLHLLLRRRTVVVFHDLYKTAAQPSRRLRPNADRLALAAHVDLAGAAVVHGDHERDRLGAVRGAARVESIPHFVEERRLPDRAEARRSLGAAADDYTISVLGYIHRRKGHRLLVEALPGLDERVKLWFIGEPARGSEGLCDEMRGRAEELGVGSRLTITGYVAEPELDARLAATDLAVCPFEDVSASGSLSTWISARRPLLATDLPPMRELAREAPGAVRLLPERSSGAIRAAVEDALSAQPVAESAFDAVLADRSPSRTAERYERICAGVAHTGLPRDPVGVAVRVGALAGRLRRALGRTSGRLALIPSAAPGSSGDEALVRSSLEGLRGRQPRRIVIGEYPGEERWSDVVAVDGALDLTDWWNESGLRRLVPAAVRLGWRLGGTEETYLIGADVLDGAYSERGSVKRMAIADLAARSGGGAVVLGSSWNEHPPAAVVDWARRTHERLRWCARDPESWDRMASDLRRDVTLTADTAFLLPADPSDASDRAVDFVRRERSAGRVVLGVNLNPLSFPDGQGPDVVAACARAVEAAVGDGAAVALLPHDNRGDPSDLSLARDLWAALSEEAAGHTHLPERVLTAQEMKALLAELDAVVAGRMHVGIGALSQGVPTRLANIQGKVAGLFRHLGIDGGAYRIDDVLAAGTFAPVFDELIAARGDERAALERRLPDIRRLAHANFQPG